MVQNGAYVEYVTIKSTFAKQGFITSTITIILPGIEKLISDIT